MIVLAKVPNINNFALNSSQPDFAPALASASAYDPTPGTLAVQSTQPSKDTHAWLEPYKLSREVFKRIARGGKYIYDDEFELTYPRLLGYLEKKYKLKAGTKLPLSKKIYAALSKDLGFDIEKFIVEEQKNIWSKMHVKLQNVNDLSRAIINANARSDSVVFIDSAQGKFIQAQYVQTPGIVRLQDVKRNVGHFNEIYVEISDETQPISGMKNTYRTITKGYVPRNELFSWGEIVNKVMGKEVIPPEKK